MNYKLIASRLRAMAEELELADPSKLRDLDPITLKVDQSDTGEMEVLGDEPILSEEEEQWLSRHGFHKIQSGDQDKVLYAKEINGCDALNNKILLMKKWERNQFGVRNHRKWENTSWWTIFTPGSKFDVDNISSLPKDLSGLRLYKNYLYHTEHIPLEDERYKWAMSQEAERLRKKRKFFEEGLELDKKMMEFYEKEGQ